MPERLQQITEVTMSPEQQEQLKRTLCTFFEAKLTELELKPGVDRTGYIQSFYELCSGSTEPWMRRKEFDLLSLALPIRIRFNRHNSYTPELRTLTLDISPLEDAQSVGELRHASVSLLESIYHESEHIFFPGDPEDPGLDLITVEEWIPYACKPSEINAFARQFAFRYRKEYGDRSFDLGTMQAFALQRKSDDPAAYNYFVAFAEPAKQQKYNHLANLAAIHDAIVEQTRGHLEKLRQRI